MEALCSPEGMAPEMSYRSSGALGSILEEHEREGRALTTSLLTYGSFVFTHRLLEFGLSKSYREPTTLLSKTKTRHTWVPSLPDPQRSAAYANRIPEHLGIYLGNTDKIPPMELTFKVKKQITKFLKNQVITHCLENKVHTIEPYRQPCLPRRSVTKPLSGRMQAGSKGRACSALSIAKACELVVSNMCCRYLAGQSRKLNHAGFLQPRQRSQLEFHWTNHVLCG